MMTHNVGYLFGSLAKALVKPAPPELVLTESPIKGLPLHNYDHGADYPPVARAFKQTIASVDGCSSSRQNTAVRS